MLPKMKTFGGKEREKLGELCQEDSPLPRVTMYSTQDLPESPLRWLRAGRGAASSSSSKRWADSLWR